MYVCMYVCMYIYIYIYMHKRQRPPFAEIVRALRGMLERHPEQGCQALTARPCGAEHGEEPRYYIIIYWLVLYYTILYDITLIMP